MFEQNIKKENALQLNLHRVVFPNISGLEAIIESFRSKFGFYVNFYPYIQILRSIGPRPGHNNLTCILSPNLF